MKKDKYDYNRFGSKGKRVGQAVVDILSKDQPTLLVEDVLDEFGRDYLNLIRKVAEVAKNEFESPFFIVSILKKDLGQFGVQNVLKHSAKAFKKKFTKKEVMDAHPNAVKNQFEVDVKKGEITLLWSLPGWEDCKSISKNPELYDKDLVKWVKECMGVYQKPAA